MGRYSFCSGHNYNITIASYELAAPSQYFYFDKDNILRGIYGKYVVENFFLTPFEKMKERCRFITTKESSVYVNNTFTGPIGLLGNSKADIFIKPEDYSPIEKSFFVDFSDVFSDFSFKPMMLIEQKLNENNSNFYELFKFLVPSVSFFLITLATILIYFGFMFFISKLNNFNSKKSIITILSFLFIIFTFYIVNFISGNLNTANVIVDTSDLLSTNEKLLATKKEACFLENSSEMDYFEKAPKNSLAYKIYEKRNKQNVCYCYENSNQGSLIKKDLSKIFILIIDKGVFTVNRIIQTLIKKNTFFAENLSVYETIRTLAISKTISNRLRKHINKLCQFHFSNGLFMKFLRDAPNWTDFQFAKQGGKDGYLTYTTLTDYIEHNTKITALSFNKLEKIDDYGSRILNFAGGITIFVLKSTLPVYKNYSKNIINYLPFGFLFCFDENEMINNYHLSKLKAKKQIKLQLIFLNLTHYHRFYYVIVFSLFVMKNCYDSIMKTSFNQRLLNCLINLIKFLGSLSFLISLQIHTLGFLLLTNEVILSFNYLIYRLDDQIDCILNLIMDNTIQNKRQSNKKINRIIKNYNLIIKDQKLINQHFNRVLNHSNLILLFIIIFLSLILNGQLNSKFLNYFYLAQFLFCYLFLSIFCYINYIYLDKNKRLWQHFGYLIKYSNLRSSINILNIYTLNNQFDVFSFNYRRIFRYTFAFLISYFIETTSLQFLLYQANQLKNSQI